MTTQDNKKHRATLPFNPDPVIWWPVLIFLLHLSWLTLFISFMGILIMSILKSSGVDVAQAVKNKISALKKIKIRFSDKG